MSKTYKNRPKYVQEMIDRANEIFKAHNVKDPYKSDLFMMMDRFLLDKDMYRGYNFYKWIEYDELGTGGRLVLAGSADPKEFDCIQLW